jgi:hypothetical protein
VLLGERDEAEMVRKKLDAWSMKFEADSRKHDESLADE